MEDYAFLNKKSESDTIFVPIGSIEVHSNLPFGTDAFISRACADLMAQKTGAAVFPTIYTGVCPGTGVFSETIGIDPTAFIAYLEKLTLALLETFPKVIYINIHNGNDASLRAAVEQIYLNHKKTVLYVNVYKCLKEKDPFLGRDNNLKEASLLYASLDTLGVDPTPYMVDKDAVPEKDKDIAALKEYGYFGYSYLSEGQHISPVAGVSLKEGIDYLNMVAESAADIIKCFDNVLTLQNEKRRRNHE